MDSITFKNFRKFKKETTFNLDMINVLVGPNSSGKSTLTKGIRLYLYNIKNLKINRDNIFNANPFFVFGGDVLNNPHIGTFGRALSKDADESNIVFSATFVDLVIEMTVSRYSVNLKNEDNSLIDYYDKTIAPIIKIVIFDKRVDTRFSYDFETRVQTAEYNVTGEVDYYSRWKQELENLKNDLKDAQSLKESEEISSEIATLENCLKLNFKEKVTWYSDLLYEQKTDDILWNLVHGWTEVINSDTPEKYKDKNRDFYQAMLRQEGAGLFYFLKIRDEILDNRYYVYSDSIQNIEAHSVTRSIVYNISDKNDYMAQTICEYMNENIKEEAPEKKFINKWMKKFEIGEDFRIESYGGESYKMEIIEDVNRSQEAVPLLDKGIGNNQIMILLLRLATIMHQNRNKLIPCIINVEEPEQNLHPQWQSLLAELFYEVYQYPKNNNQESWGITLLVETHSEYLVRQVQVITAKCFKRGDDGVPFSVCYFTGKNDNPYYEMGFQKNGKFERPFGTGFFNVADDAAMELFDLEDEN